MNKLIKVILFLIVGMVQAFAWGGLRGDTLAKELDEAVLNRNMRSTTNYTRNSRKYNKTRPSIT